jgi:hypothetical protein
MDGGIADQIFHNPLSQIRQFRRGDEFIRNRVTQGSGFFFYQSTILVTAHGLTLIFYQLFREVPYRPNHMQANLKYFP